MANDKIPRELLLASIETTLDTQFGGLLVSYLATRDKLAQIAKTEWYDGEKSRLENKMKMKELGGVLFSYSEFLAASTIHLLADILEDTWTTLRKDIGFEYDLWKPSVSVEFEHEARLARAAANVLKHNRGRLTSKTSQHAKFLVDDCGLIDGYELVAFATTDPPKLDIFELIYRCYVYCWGLAKAVFGNEDGLLALPDEERKPLVLDILVPRALGLRV